MMTHKQQKEFWIAHNRLEEVHIFLERIFIMSLFSRRLQGWR
jgi:hypothetical protein